MERMVSIWLAAGCLIGAHASGVVSSASDKEEMFAANPVRRVVSLLQGIGKKVEAEGERSKELFDKFMCSCKKQRAESAQAIADMQGKSPMMASDTAESQQKVAQLEMQIAAFKKDASSAQAAITAATKMRATESEANLAESSETENFMKVLSGAVEAIAKGQSSAFLQAQTGSKMRLLKALDGAQSLDEYDKESVVSFISSADNAPSGGEVLGILKSIHDGYQETYDAAVAREQEQKDSFEQLMGAKTRQAKSLAAGIEKKIGQKGQLSVSIVSMKGEMASADAANAANEKFAAELEKSCNTREAENDKAVKARGEELIAVADTIKILNDDDARDLFKKAIPSTSLLQIVRPMKQQKRRALAILRATPRGTATLRPQLDFIQFSLSGRSADVNQIQKMIDDMLNMMKEQGVADAEKLQYCEQKIANAHDKERGLKTKVIDGKHNVEEQEEIVATTDSEVQTVTKSVDGLDANTDAATSQRKAEHAEYMKTMGANSGAKQLLSVAKDRLNKFYNPGTASLVQSRHSLASLVQSNNFYNPGTGRASLMQVSQHDKLASSQACRSVIHMLDKLMQDLELEMHEAKLDEKSAQKDYERLVEDSASKRTRDVEAISEKEGTKADAEQSRVQFFEASEAEKAELIATGKYEKTLHVDCDWLTTNHDLVTKSRADEAEQLMHAKDALAGENLSLIQGDVRKGKHLRGV